jgi:UrcA family protein
MKTNTTSLDRQALQVLLAGIAAVTFAPGAEAGEPAGADRLIRSVVVDYSDLDLSEARDAQVMYARLTAAARTACGNESTARDLRRAADYRACRDRALNDAVVGVDSTRLQALHAARHERTKAG